MPSVLLTGQSGGMPLISGTLGSGYLQLPQAGIQLVLDQNASGRAYVGLSGGVTVNSGSYPLSGGGGMDGMPMSPGAGLWIPRGAIRRASGNALGVTIACDPACSGQARMFWEAY